MMRRSHRFLMGHIFSTVFGPLELLSIAFIVIILPILIAPLQYRSAKERFGALQQAGAALKEIEDALNEKQVVSGLTSYIFLILDVLRPADTLDDVTSESDVENIRNHLAGLTRKVVTEVIFQGALYTLLIFNFLIPEFLSALEQGTPMLAPLVFLGVIIAILVARWVIFFYWRLLAKRWLSFYQGFIAWGEELEKVFSNPTNDYDGRATT
ncbi:MAG: hypothetical protein ACXADO_12220 [Candidatus Thorarchaeota archaeon]